MEYKMVICTDVWIAVIVQPEHSAAASYNPARTFASISIHIVIQSCYNNMTRFQLIVINRKA